MPEQPGAERDPGASAFNVPNTLCAIRLVGSFGLVYLAVAGRPTAFLCLYVFLVFTDWIDGKLAILLHQRTEFGARLDSAADAMLYAGLLFGFCWLKWEFVLQQAWWIFAALASYALTAGAGLIKFKRMPSYHTWAAKGTNHLVFIAVICLFADWAVWPFYVAIWAAILTNLEATAITLTLPQWRADVRSIYHAIRKEHSRPC
jgi:CDP-diacylglycerol--glycerol-3-phosphate 3-phosphatidyltransferase